MSISGARAQRLEFYADTATVRVKPGAKYPTPHLDDYNKHNSPLRVTAIPRVNIVRWVRSSHKYLHFFSFLDANSNHVNEDQPEAEVGVSHEDSTPGESVEREEEASKEAELGSAQDAPAGPQLSEE